MFKKLKATFSNLFTSTPANTADDTTVQLKLIELGILEMEDVLFHHDSNVMMPEAPAGPSSGEGSSGQSQAESDRDGEQITFSGLRALAMVYNRLEMYPEQGVFIAGHTDTSGGHAINYAISKLRALNIKNLLDLDRTRWGLSQHRQKVEDHQQILQFFATNDRYQWDTDPGEIDNKWGPKTEGALQKFVDHYQAHYATEIAANPDGADPNEPEALPPTIVAAVKKNSKHDWPPELWRAVFDLYTEEMADALELRRSQLRGHRDQHLRWADQGSHLVGCGESYPIDKAGKDNYKSQKNRRVEVLFFNQGEFPADFRCPIAEDRAHTATECPLWHNQHFTPVYLDPFTLTSVPFHLKFQYFDNVHGKYLDVPDGLTLESFGAGDKKIHQRQRFSGGVYTLQLVEKELDESLQFGFASTNLYIYSADDATDPVIKEITLTDFEALSDEEKYKHYALPAEWKSGNQWTRPEADLTQGDLFENVLKDKGYKPHGGNAMAADKPLTFCLDDLVLLDMADATQELKDADGLNAPKDLSDVSRVKILQVDPATHALKLYQTAADDPKTARILFPKANVGGTEKQINRVVDMAPYTKIVFFKEGFYTVGNKRTKAEPAWRTRGFAVGARAAVRNDKDHHVGFVQMHSDNEYGYTGDHVANYFHGLHMDGKHLTSYYVYSVSMNFMLDCRPKWTGGVGSSKPAAAEPSAADLKKFTDVGVYDAMEHWNKKNYWLEETSEAEDALRVRPMWFFEEKETFEVVEADQPEYSGTSTDPTGGTRDIDADEQRDLLGQSHQCVKDARAKARGGQARFMCFVCRDDNFPDNYGLAYAWAIRDKTWAKNFAVNRGSPEPEFAVMKLNKSAWMKNGTTFAPTVPVTEYGHKYGVFTLAHELGHCTGQSDEYINDGNLALLTNAAGEATASQSLPKYRQFYEPYTMLENNGTAMMYLNGSPRLRYLWFAMHAMHKAGSAGGLSKFLASKQFVARFKHGSDDLRYHRNFPGLHAILRRPIPSAAGTDDEHYSISNSPFAEVRLEMHWVGEDEASIRRFHPGQNPANAKDRYQAVLVVRPMIRLRFTNSGGNWSANSAKTRARNLNREIQRLGGKYRLTGGTGQVKNIMVHFLAGYTRDSGDSDTNVQLRYTRAEHPAPGKTISTSGSTIRIGRTVAASKVVERLFNKADGTNWLTTLAFLKTFADSKFAGENFTLEQI